MSDLDITDSVLAELRSAADIVEVIGEHTQAASKAGRSWKGLCPFHSERTPSFTVDRDKGLYHCFGCGAGGDVIHFVRQMDRLEFPEAVEALAGRFGVAIPRRARGPRDDRRERLLEARRGGATFLSPRSSRKPGNPAAAIPGRARRSRSISPAAWRSATRRKPGSRSRAALSPAAIPRRSSSKRASCSRAPRGGAPTTGSATASSSSSATSAGGPSDSEAAPSPRTRTRNT